MARGKGLRPLPNHVPIQFRIDVTPFPATPMAEDSLIPSLSDGVVGSRFITQDEIDSARARKEEQWKAAYARYWPSTTVLFHH
jgi:hypothetical protein